VGSALQIKKVEKGARSQPIHQAGLVWETLNPEAEIALIEVDRFSEQRGLRSRNFRAQKLASGQIGAGGRLGFFSICGAVFFLKLAEESRRHSPSKDDDGNGRIFFHFALASPLKRPQTQSPSGWLPRMDSNHE
jgi:hypothetical protein